MKKQKMKMKKKREIEDYAKKKKIDQKMLSVF